MNDKLRPLRGTKDLLPKDFAIHNYIINTAKRIGELYGYESMSTPIIEYTKVFDRTLGDTSDVISKEMYSFLDRSNESIALRPEFTAGIIRAFISNGLTYNIPLKFFSTGPLFRYDRPQLGRQRQLHQVNYEYIGAQEAYSDAETLKLAQDLLIALEVMDDVTLELNSLGCEDSRALYQKKLTEYFHDHKSTLSEDSIRRLSKNPLRILDSKDEGDKKIILNAPLVSDYYTDSARKYFDEVLEYLNLLGVKYTINQRLVRGLDYYCHTAFEFTTSKLGSQSTLIGGGRYDGLVKLMGGPDTKAIGFAGGIERLSMMREYNVTQGRSVIIMPIGDDNLGVSLVLADKLRQNNLKTIVDNKGKIDKRLVRALDQCAKYVIFIGDDERKSGKYKLKDLDKREELSLTIETILRYMNLI